MATFRRFTNTDYLGYEGAEDLPDGTRPLISRDTDPWVTYLITGNGEEEGRELARIHLSVHVFRNPETEEEGEEWWIREIPAEATDLARRIGKLLPPDADPLTLRALGFSRSI